MHQYDLAPCNVLYLLHPSDFHNPEQLAIIIFFFQECDLGQKSILHAVKIRHINKQEQTGGGTDMEGSRPMNETLVDWQLSAGEHKHFKTEEGNNFFLSGSFFVFFFKNNYMNEEF